MNDRSPVTGYYDLEVAARLVRLPPARVRRYVRVGLVQPSRLEGRTALFGEAELARLRTIRRLGEDLGINAAGVEVVLRLVDEIRALTGNDEPRKR
ncbi:MAG: MerR family transcriptional regulator, heat shock protein HspR [Pseudonocardiales bacterium]|nr:MerR family transcriptional regulator, heat shock protein HspR [Pseudonocardiales bacterium]